MTIEFFLSSECYRDAGRAYENTRKELAKLIETRFGKNTEYGRLAGIFIIPAIMPDELHEKYKTILKFDKSENAIEFRPFISYTTFMSMGPEERYLNIVGKLYEIVPLIPKLNLPTEVESNLRDFLSNPLR